MMYDCPCMLYMVCYAAKPRLSRDRSANSQDASTGPGQRALSHESVHVRMHGLPGGIAKDAATLDYEKGA